MKKITLELIKNITFKYKNILKIIGFLVLFGGLFGVVSEVFLHKSIKLPWDVQRKIEGFYQEPKNSLDVIFYGNSSMFCNVNPNIIWNKYGIPAYIFASNEQPFWISYHYIIESLKYQKPKVIVLDLLYSMWSLEDCLELLVRFLLKIVMQLDRW